MDKGAMKWILWILPGPGWAQGQDKERDPAQEEAEEISSGLHHQSCRGDEEEATGQAQTLGFGILPPWECSWLSPG